MTTASNSSDLPRNGGQRPVPDPTILSTEKIEREVASLRQLLQQRIDAVEQLLEQRVDGMVATRTVEFERFGEKIERLRGVTDERFASIATQFLERDTRQERESRDNKVAIDTAFAAQKESAAKQDESNAKAINKSEIATTETIKKLSELFKTTTDAQSDKHDDLKERVTTLEQRKVGAQEVTAQHGLDRGQGIALAGVAVAVAAVIAAVLLSGGSTAVVVPGLWLLHRKHTLRA